MIRHILRGPIPTIGDKWSTEFKDFVATCLVKDASERATAKDLLDHPWLAGAIDHQIELTNLIDEHTEI